MFKLSVVNKAKRYYCLIQVRPKIDKNIPVIPGKKYGYNNVRKFLLLIFLPRFYRSLTVSVELFLSFLTQTFGELLTRCSDCRIHCTTLMKIYLLKNVAPPLL